MPGRLLAYDSQKHILTTRDGHRFRPMQSPVAPIVHSLFQIIRSPQFNASISASPLPDNFPMVAIVQGSARTDALLANSDSSSFPSTAASEPQSIHPVDVIFIPFIIHQELSRSIEEKDSVQTTQLKIFAVSSVLHEFAHWVHTRTVGYTPDPERSALTSDAATDASSQSGKVNNSLLELGRRSNDVGVKLTGKFMEFHYELISWTSGHATVVRRRIIRDTAMQNLIPLEEILGGPVTDYPIDVSSLSEARACPAEVSNWITDQQQARSGGIDLSKVILTRTGPNAMCQHGKCRI